MCGIVGSIDNISPSIPAKIIPYMRDVMLNRGPDGEGTFVEGSIAMSMRRLSIIDLANGWQPLTSRNGQVIAFQNGEIYNYLSLRKELEQQGYVFQTNSDTEVLAHGYAHWGIDGLLNRVDGMYAIAILDRQSRELHLARDRFGEKPLFYCCQPDRFAYSSNLIGLAALPWVDSRIDLLSLDRYLGLHFIPGERTIIRGIKRVLPGERLSIPLDAPTPRRYRYYQPSVERDHPIELDELAELLEEAVTSRLIADVPVGVFLSGGLDSSIIAAIASRHTAKISTFSIGFPSTSHDESPHAQRVARAIDSDHHHFQFDGDRFISLLPKVAAALDEPVGDQATLPLYWLCQEARQFVTVVLSGEGADEIFGGYDYYRLFSQPTTFKNKIKALFQRTGNRSDIFSPGRPTLNRTPSGFPLLTTGAERKRLISMAFDRDEAWETELSRSIHSISNKLNRACFTDLTTWLPDDLLIKFDRMAMAHSLEGRAPYLQTTLVERGLRLPNALKMDRRTNKIGLRQIAERWLPREIITRPKQGFVLPMSEWLERWFQEYNGIKSYFNEFEFPGLNIDELILFFEQNANVYQERSRLIFALVLLMEWYRSFLQATHNLKKVYSQFT
jgi:asparagine synthase (glutamine-hydrolysing)